MECTFGILKGRFRVLKNGIRVRGPAATDNIWLTCCALHNFLLEEDGLDQPWEKPVSIETWLEPGFANHSDRDLLRMFGMEEVSDAHRELDATATGQQMPPWAVEGEDDNHSVDVTALPPPAVRELGDSTSVNSLSLRKFRSKLIEHFDVLFHQNKLKWPSRSGLGAEPVVSLPKAWRSMGATADE